jgi:NAD(P)-dependent dehydrogenase (short-subunit alcohol dehydrogenase family)
MKTTQTILITGATAGIGRTTALHLARAGHHVLASGRGEAALETLAADAKKEGLRLDTIRLDVTRAESIAAAVAEADRLTGGKGVDVLVNNAGYGIAAPIAEISDGDLRAQFETNVFGLVAVTRAFVPAMRARGRGRVINISSIGGRMTVPFLGAYNATKHAVESLSDAMRFELHAFGIDTVLIEPGAIRTDFAQRTMREAAAYHNEASVYAPALVAYRKLAARADELAPGPEKIARVVERAVNARRPRARYVAPFTGLLTLWMARLMPQRLLDWTFRKVLGLTRNKLAPASPSTSAENPPLRAVG